MKSFLCAIFILLFVITGAGVYAYTLNDTIYNLENHVAVIEKAAKNEQWLHCQNAIDDMMADWEHTQKRYKTFIEHKELDGIYEILHEVKGYAMVYDKKTLLVKTGVLKILIRHLAENEKLTLENIL